MTNLLAVNVRLYNNRLRSLRLRKGWTAAELCRRVPMQQTEYSLLERLKESPKTKKGLWRKPVMLLAEYWKTTEDTLFPDELLRMYGYEVEFEVHPNEIRDIGLGLSQFSREMSIPESRLLRKELYEKLDDLVSKTLLNEKENRIFRMRFFEGLSPQEIGNRFHSARADIEKQLDASMNKMRANFIRIERPNDSFIVNLERTQ
jgi:transcriptional regulator with XRE-family HTH domain